MIKKVKKHINKVLAIILTMCLLMNSGMAELFGFVGDEIIAYAASLPDNDFTWNLGSDGVLTITGTGEMPEYDWYSSSFQKSDVKSVVVGEGVTTISSYIFSGAGNLTSVTLPSTLKEIGTEAFYKCNLSGDMELPKGLEIIDHRSFSYCNGLKKVVIPDSVRTIRQGAFQGSINLAEVNYPLSWVEAGDNILNETAVKEIEIPEGVTKIPAYAFSETHSLEKVVFPGTLKEIGTEAFYKCNLSGGMELPEGLEIIDHRSFSYCNGLKKVIIPDSVRTIRQGAFECSINLAEINYPLSWVEAGDNILNETAVKEIEIPEGITKIPAYAFAGTDSLETVLIPDTVKDIGYNAFAECPLLNVCVNGYSKCLINLIDQNIAFKVLSRKRNEETKVIEEDGCNYTTNFSSVKNGGSISITCDYSINTAYTKLKGAYITIKIPNGTELLQKTLMYNEKLCNTFTDNNETITIPVSSQSGKITFSLKILENVNIVSYATLNYKLNNKEDYDIIGIINEDIPTISVSAPSVTNTDKVIISGIAPAESDVLVYIDDKYVKRVMSNKVGSYSTDIKLDNLEDEKQYTIKVLAIDENSNEIYAVTTIRYSPETPTMTDFVLNYNGNTYNLLSDSKPNITFVAGNCPMNFMVKFDYPEKVKKVYVTSDRGNVTKRMEAVWDENLNAFVANGYFDESDNNYVPGKINVYYAEEDSMLDFANTIELTDESYNEMFGDATVEITKNTNTEVEYEITLADNSKLALGMQEYQFEDGIRDMLGDDADKVLTKSISGRNYRTSALDLYSDSDDYITLGKMLINFLTDSGKNVVKKVTKDGTEYIYYQKWENGDLLTYLIDTGKGAVFKSFLKNAGPIAATEFLDQHLDSIVTYDLGSFVWNELYGTYQVVDSYSNTRDQIDDIRKSVSLSGKTEQEKLYINNLLDDYSKQARNIAICKGILNLVSSASKVVGIGTFTPQGLLLEGALLLVENVLMTLWEDKLNDNIAYLQGLSDDSSINWAIDPSGYVYEGVTSNRLSGVKTTAYWIPYDEEKDDETFWDAPQTDRAELWNASDWSQQNPLITDNDGNYAWDVPEGWWQVKYELDGYETTYSEWMPVPPPQTNVNIGMISTKKAQVENAEITDEGVKVVFDQYIDPQTVSKIELKNVNGEPVNYTISYIQDETNAEGKVLAKEFLLKTSTIIKSITVPESVLNYAEKSVEVYNKIFESSVVLGDTNNDGEINIADALMISRYDAGLAELNEDQLAVSDVNNDGEVNIADALMISRFDAGLIDSL